LIEVLQSDSCDSCQKHNEGSKQTNKIQIKECVYHQQQLKLIIIIIIIIIIHMYIAHLPNPVFFFLGIFFPQGQVLNKGGTPPATLITTSEAKERRLTILLDSVTFQGRTVKLQRGASWWVSSYFLAVGSINEWLFGFI